MGKILVLGPKVSLWSTKIENAVYCELPTFTLGEEGERQLSEFIANNVSSDITALVIDFDSTDRSELCLAIAMCLRLSIIELKALSLMPILFVSKRNIDNFRNCQYSSLLLTDSISLETPERSADAIEVMTPLSISQYRQNFLNRIKINPNSTEGRHSLANQWGADVLNRIVTRGVTQNISILKARTSLYFKYIMVQALSLQELTDLVEGKNIQLLIEKQPPINAAGKRILLIDDNADKGWYDAIKCMFSSNAIVQQICEKVADYESLSDKARKEIETGEYDLIFLDLRMNGVDEEDNYKPEEFSGMKILKKIKSLNQGTQVIMFTASNKAWNLKALLDEGADGYYIKESPEYLFPIKYSENNAKRLRADIKRCLERSYLRQVYLNFISIKKHLTTHSNKSFSSLIGNQLDSVLLQIIGARTPNQFAFAYVALEQIFEMISKEFIGVNKLGKYYVKETKVECNNWKINENKDCVISEEPIGEDYPQWKRIASLYYQYFGEKDSSFGNIVQYLIDKRNAFMHNETDKLQGYIDINRKRQPGQHADIYTQDAFIELCRTIKKLLLLV